MKKIGNKFAFYPTPVFVVGAMVGEKPDFTLVAHMGVVSHDAALISLNKSHYINQGIKEKKALSVNVVDESWLQKAAVSGSVSGRNVDKSTLFDYTIGESGAPLIKDCKLVMECAVDDIYEYGAFENFIVKVTATYADENILSADGDKPDYDKFKPTLFEMPGYTFLNTGESLGKCKSYINRNR